MAVLKSYRNLLGPLVAPKATSSGFSLKISGMRTVIDTKTKHYFSKKVIVSTNFKDSNNDIYWF